MEEKCYLCIDLKSFYASCECVDRGLDSLKTKLVVADPTHGPGAICLAVSPRLKELGVRNRCRLFEIPDSIEYICAVPRMKRYMEISAKIYSIYLKYVSADDIHVYSIDECFIDVSKYLSLYHKTYKELAKIMIDDVYKTTGICATVGIGTNLFLTKLALDITAKHTEDHMGYLNEKLFKEQIWHHTPITDVWNISHGTARRLLKYGVSDLYGITTVDEDLLYKEFGINAELIIDHAYGKESCTISDIKKYKSKGNSISRSQILLEDYSYEDALLAFKEMADEICLDLVRNKLATNSIGVYVGYSKDIIPSTGGSRRLDCITNSNDLLNKEFVNLFKETTDPSYKIRRLGLGFGNVVSEVNITFNLFTDFKKEEKERKLEDTIIAIQNKYGNNSILKARSYQEKSMARKRNALIGGHNAGDGKIHTYLMKGNKIIRKEDE